MTLRLNQARNRLASRVVSQRAFPHLNLLNLQLVTLRVSLLLNQADSQAHSLPEIQHVSQLWNRQDNRLLSRRGNPLHSPAGSQLLLLQVSRRFNLPLNQVGSRTLLLQVSHRLNHLLSHQANLPLILPLGQVNNLLRCLPASLHRNRHYNLRFSHLHSQLDNPRHRQVDLLIPVPNLLASLVSVP